MKSLTEFGSRLVTLNNGAQGLRGGLHCTVKEVPGTDPVMDFIASDETIDRYNECIKLSGWELDNFLANPVVPDCHDYSSISCILGRDILTKAQQIENGALQTRVLFAVENPLGNLAFKMAKGGFIKSQSVGFMPLEWTNGNSKDQPDRTYTRQELLEKSIVVIPVNPGATVGLALKSGAIVKRDLTALLDFLKQFCKDETADPAAKASASGAGVHDAQLLQIARGIKDVLKRA